MPQTMSVTEARDNFPALVRRVAERDEPILVTSHNQPKAVLLRWETYQEQQQMQVEGARYRLERGVEAMEKLTATLVEGFRPHSMEIEQGIEDLAALAREAWKTCRVLERQWCYLASLLSDVVENKIENGTPWTEEQLAHLLPAIRLLGQENISMEMVAAIDLSLLAVGLNSLLPMTDAELDQYLALIEEPL